MVLTQIYLYALIKAFTFIESAYVYNLTNISAACRAYFKVPSRGLTLLEGR